MELIEEFSTNLLQAIGTAHAGRVASAHAPRLIADGGGRGVGSVNHVSFRLLGDDVIESTVYYDVGSMTSGQLENHKDYNLVTTASGPSVVGT
jgi:hypothetical protein